MVTRKDILEQSRDGTAWLNSLVELAFLLCKRSLPGCSATDRRTDKLCCNRRRRCLVLVQQTLTTQTREIDARLLKCNVTELRRKVECSGRDGSRHDTVRKPLVVDDVLELRTFARIRCEDRTNEFLRVRVDWSIVRELVIVVLDPLVDGLDVLGLKRRLADEQSIPEEFVSDGVREQSTNLQDDAV